MGYTTILQMVSGVISPEEAYEILLREKKDAFLSVLASSCHKSGDGNRMYTLASLLGVKTRGKTRQEIIKDLVPELWSSGALDLSGVAVAAWGTKTTEAYAVELGDYVSAQMALESCALEHAHSGYMDLHQSVVDAAWRVNVWGVMTNHAYLTDPAVVKFRKVPTIRESARIANKAYSIRRSLVLETIVTRRLVPEVVMNRMDQSGVYAAKLAKLNTELIETVSATMLDPVASVRMRGGKVPWGDGSIESIVGDLDVKGSDPA